MEELQTKFSRLSTEEKKIFFDQMSKADSALKSSYTSDNEDEDWFPFPGGDESQDSSETSDDEEFDNEDRKSESEEDNELYKENESKEAATKLSGSATTVLTEDKTPRTKKFSIDNRTAIRRNSFQKVRPANTKSLSVSEAFQAIFSKEMVDIIVHCTNKNATTVYRKYNESNSFEKQLEWKDLTPREFYAFLGVLLMAGLNKSNTDESSEMWSPTSYPLYRATMSLNRFRNILNFIEFDDVNTRYERTRDDKAAAIRDIWMILNSNLSKMYRPIGRIPAIDEQFFPCKDRTGFTHYVPSKKAKHGIIVWWMRDPVTSYPVNGQIYTGNLLSSALKKSGNKESEEPDNKQNIIGRMLELHTTRRRTKRWPLAFFYNILDVSNFAAYIVYHKSHRIIKKKNQRQVFLRKLCEELCLPVIKERSQNLQIMRDYETRVAIESIFGKIVKPVNNIPIVTRKTLKLLDEKVVDSCHICYQDVIKTRRRTDKLCAGCDKPVCDQHVITIKCKDCNK